MSVEWSMRLIAMLNIWICCPKYWKILFDKFFQIQTIYQGNPLIMFILHVSISLCKHWTYLFNFDTDSYAWQQCVLSIGVIIQTLNSKAIN